MAGARRGRCSRPGPRAFGPAGLHLGGQRRRRRAGLRGPVADAALDAVFAAHQ